MATQCSRDLFGYEVVEGRQVVAAFDGGDATSDAGALLLGAADRAIGLVERFASCFVDGRVQTQVEHSVAAMVAQRVFGIALGYEDILIALIAYGAIAIPLGSEMGFLAFSLAGGDLIDWLLRWPIIFFFTALPEELLFRGLIQNQLQARLGNARAALGVTAVIFGLAHLNNPLPGFAVPNWTYGLMAALAGIAYGWTWHRTHKITASAIVHASVNFTWASFLSG